MIDIETMGTRPGAPIVEIGAVAFDLDRGIFANLALRVCLEDSMTAGLKPDASTILWWMSQSDEARLAIAKPAVKPLRLREALVRLAEFIGAHAVATEGSTFWAKGSSFDHPILAEGFRAVGMEKPWPYWQERCLRTLTGAFPDAKPAKFAGTAHTALADARNQAESVLKVWRVLRERDLTR